VIEEENYLIPVPPNLRDVGVLVEPLTIAEKALLQTRCIQERLPWECRHLPDGAPHVRHTALVLGSGPVGLLGAMLLCLSGFETYVYSRDALGTPKASVAEAIGAKYFTVRDHTAETLAREIGQIDLIYEATGASKISFDAMTALGTNGVFIFTGVPGRKGPIELDADRIMRELVLRNQVVLGTVNAGRDAYEAAVRDLGLFAARKPEAVRSLITQRFPMEEFHAALGTLGGIKKVVSVHGES